MLSGSGSPNPGPASELAPIFGATGARAQVPRVLSVAGSDSGGGAGIQADIKTCMALGAFCCTAVTAVTAQDTRGVHAVHVVPSEFVARQMEAVLGDIGADVVKTGMLPTPEVRAALCCAGCVGGHWGWHGYAGFDALARGVHCARGGLGWAGLDWTGWVLQDICPRCD